jgi:hypothetical protein
VAFVAALARFGAVCDREHWREVAINLEQEVGSAADLHRAIAQGFVMAKVATRSSNGLRYRYPRNVNPCRLFPRYCPREPSQQAECVV